MSSTAKETDKEVHPNAEVALRIASNELSRLLFNEASETTHKAIDAVDAALAEAKKIESATITREEAEVIRALMAEFYLKGELSLKESRVFLKLCSKFDFGRPVNI